jgi:hypothetical protein
LGQAGRSFDVAEYPALREDGMRNCLGLFAAIAMSVWFSAAGASFVPHLTPAEQQRYQELKKDDPSAARAYLDTRNYVSICQQGLDQSSRILEIGIQPEDYDARYATPDEVKLVKRAISLWMKATVAQ